MNPPKFEIGEQVFEDYGPGKIKYIVRAFAQQGSLWVYTLEREGFPLYERIPTTTQLTKCF